MISGEWKYGLHSSEKVAVTKYIDFIFLEELHISFTSIENLSCWYGTQIYPDFFVFEPNIELESYPYLFFHNFFRDRW